LPHRERHLAKSTMFRKELSLRVTGRGRLTKPCVVVVRTSRSPPGRRILNPRAPTTPVGRVGVAFDCSAVVIVAGAVGETPTFQSEISVTRGVSESGRTKRGPRSAVAPTNGVRVKTTPESYSSSAEAIKEGVGRNSGCSSPPAPSSSASPPPFLFPFPPLPEFPL
jgi:hypothetical protein